MSESAHKVLFLLTLSIQILLMSCNSNESEGIVQKHKKSVIFKNNVYNNSDTIFNLKPIQINHDMSNTTNTNIIEFEKSEIGNKNNVKNDSSCNLQLIPNLNEEVNPILEDVENLIILLNYYDDMELSDCYSVETTVKDFTNKFFIVINNIQLDDTVAIAKLLELENFLTVFEKDFERVETDCPDLYNDYMEYLDELIDLHKKKLETLFGNTELPG